MPLRSNLPPLATLSLSRPLISHGIIVTLYCSCITLCLILLNVYYLLRAQMVTVDYNHHIVITHCYFPYLLAFCVWIVFRLIALDFLNSFILEGSAFLHAIIMQIKMLPFLWISLIKEHEHTKYQYKHDSTAKHLSVALIHFHFCHFLFVCLSLRFHH